MAEGFILKRWLVTVEPYGEGVYFAPTRGKALADAWRCDAFSDLTFGQFLKIARCRRDHITPPRWGDPITVEGKPAFFLGNNRQCVQIALPGDVSVVSAHPYDVHPVEYRPDNYRDREAA